VKLQLEVKEKNGQFQGQVKKYKSFLSKEKKKRAIREKKIKAKGKKRKKPCLIQKKNED